MAIKLEGGGGLFKALMDWPLVEELSLKIIIRKKTHYFFGNYIDINQINS